MARRAWLGIELPQNLGLSSFGREQKVGLVLSGGGSKASFQIGALRYLYEVVGIAPTAVVGTSAGSILTAMIAQSADPAEQAASVRELERMWFDMRRQGDMFTQRAWFQRFQARVPALMSLVQQEGTRGWFAERAVRLQQSLARSAQTTPEQLVAEMTADEFTGAGESLAPELETLALATNDPQPKPQELTVNQVMAVLAGVSRMRGVSADVGVILAGAEKTRSMYVPGPLLHQLLGSGVYSSSKVANSGMTVRIATTALESGAVHFMREDGYLVDRDDVPIGGNAHDFSRGVLASCSIPAVFAPVLIDQEHYVDGGVRENVPAEMAIGNLGCTTTWVVTSSAPGVKPADDFSRKDMFSIIMRATEIQSDETERDEIAYARSAGAIVIEPEVDVHDPLAVDPGLIRIFRDYGWMRAAEVHLGATTAEQALGRSIITARRRIWEIERDLLDPDKPHDEREVLLLARLKYDLRDQVPRLRPGIAPEGAEQWWQDWEAHPEEPTMRAPWLVEP